MEWTKQTYNSQYNKWMPWVEDQYLYYFTKDNKASYATKSELDKSKITGNEQIDNAQDGVNNLVSGQVGKGGLLQPVGDKASKDGINRAERGGKDDKGGYGAPAGGDSYLDSAKNGAKSAGGYVSSFSPWGGKKEEKK